MDVIKVSKKLLDYAYTCADILLSFKSLGLRVRFGNEIRRNKRLKDSHLGERCYVVGNGPSLNEIELSRLSKETLIAVNMLYLHSDYNMLDPMYHCAIDPAMYKGEVGRTFLKAIKDHEQTNFLISSKAPKEFKSLSNCYCIALGYLPSTLCRPYDLSKPSAAFVNVVLVAIELALYLGFSEIVLVGCDFNQFAVRKESHSYKELQSQERNATMFQDLQGHAIAVMQHEWLRDYADSRGVSIVNATEGSFLDVYPRCDIDDLLKSQSGDKRNPERY